MRARLKKELGTCVGDVAEDFDERARVRAGKAELTGGPTAQRERERAGTRGQRLGV